MTQPRTGGQGAGDGVSVQDTSGSQKAARAFVSALHSSLRAVRLYPVENAAVRNSLQELDSATARIFGNTGHCSLHSSGDSLFVNDTRLRLQLDSYASLSFVLGCMRNAGVQAVIWQSVPDSASWVVLLNALLEPAGDLSGSECAERLADRLETAKIDSVIIEPANDDDDFNLDQEDEKERARQTYMRSLHVARDLMVAARMGRSPALKQAKRAVQGIVDSIMSDSVSLIGLTTLREFDDYTFVHSVNVCIMSIALGRRIGLSKIQLFDLGLAALMHDVGKARVPLEVLHKQEALTDAEFAVLQTHTWRGILALFSMGGGASRAWRAMTVAHEHHMRVDMSGYPKTMRETEQSLFSKIVAVADGFDAATTVRTYQPQPWTPADVLRGMRENKRLGFDQVLVKAFINLTGIYPIGTVVELDTGEIALVIAPPPENSAPARPQVRILFDSRGNQTEGIARLTEQNSDGSFIRTIIRTEDPDRYGIRVGDYFA